MNKFIYDTKLLKEQSKHQKHCEFCGHTISFYFYEKDRKCCRHCGRFNYRNEFVKFKYKLMEKGLKVEKCKS